MTTSKKEHPKIFISYSHDDNHHKDRVAMLAQRLRQDGFETKIDEYESGTPTQGWLRWGVDQIEWADYILLVCTERYYRCFRGNSEANVGKGVDWEGVIITNELYSMSSIERFIPVLFDKQSIKYIPEPIRAATNYLITSDDAYKKLTDHLSGTAGIDPAPIGPPRNKGRKNIGPLKFNKSSDSGDESVSVNMLDESYRPPSGYIIFNDEPNPKVPSSRADKHKRKFIFLPKITLSIITLTVVVVLGGLGVVFWAKRGNTSSKLSADPTTTPGEIHPNNMGYLNLKDIRIADEAFENDNYTVALRLYLMYEQFLDGQHLLNIGWIYEVNKDNIKAKEYYEAAINKKCVAALNYLGNLYHQAQDDHTAKKLYQEAADKGDVDAMFNLGALYEKGNNYDDAIKWYSQAADSGNLDAEYKLSKLKYR